MYKGRVSRRWRSDPEAGKGNDFLQLSKAKVSRFAGVPSMAMAMARGGADAPVLKWDGNFELELFPAEPSP